ncbi:MAG: hypothetical protein U1F43_02130 [Myxococcota bacterium]
MSSTLSATTSKPAASHSACDHGLSPSAHGMYGLSAGVPGAGHDDREPARLEAVVQRREEGRVVDAELHEVNGLARRVDVAALQHVLAHDDVEVAAHRGAHGGLGRPAPEAQREVAGRHRDVARVGVELGADLVDVDPDHVEAEPPEHLQVARRAEAEVEPARAGAGLGARALGQLEDARVRQRRAPALGVVVGLVERLRFALHHHRARRARRDARGLVEEALHEGAGREQRPQRRGLVDELLEQRVARA